MAMLIAGLPDLSVLPSLTSLYYQTVYFQTPKYVSIDVPIVGILHRLCQFGALVYVVANMWYGNGWAAATVPMGLVNAWAEVGGYRQASQSFDLNAPATYCSNPDFAYDYGGGWQYGTKDAPPICNSPNPYTVTEKSVNSVFFTTAYIEKTEYGFPCSRKVVSDAAAKLQCAAKLGENATLVHNNGQCVCTSPSQTYYPLNIESMELAFEHFFHTPEEVKVGGASLNGESNNRDADQPLRTTLVAANGTEWEWEAGPAIMLPLSSVLLAAHHAVCNKGSTADLRDGDADGACRTGVHLDEPNVNLQPDVGNASRYPTFRTAGVTLSIEIMCAALPYIKALPYRPPSRLVTAPPVPYPPTQPFPTRYTNANARGLAEINRKTVQAKVKAIVQTGAFSSVGGSTTWNRRPSGEIGAET